MCVKPVSPGFAVFMISSATPNYTRESGRIHATSVDGSSHEVTLWRDTTKDLEAVLGDDLALEAMMSLEMATEWTGWSMTAKTGAVRTTADAGVNRAENVRTSRRLAIRIAKCTDNIPAHTRHHQISGVRMQPVSVIWDRRKSSCPPHTQ